MEILKKWWQGEEYYIEGVYPGIRYKKHWSSAFVQNSIDHIVKNNIAYSTITAIVGSLLTLLSLFL